MTRKPPDQPLGLLFGKQQVSETVASLRLVLFSCRVYLVGDILSQFVGLNVTQRWTSV